MMPIHAVQRWRIRTKLKLVNGLGGKCGICGYSKCSGAMAFHHLGGGDPKIASISRLLAHPRGWGEIIAEAKKCVLLCLNCHAEVHSGIILIPIDILRFNELLAIDHDQEIIEESLCPICGKKRKSYNITCSRACGATISRKVKWEYSELKKMVGSGMSNVAIAEECKCSDSAVHKRRKKWGI